MFGRDIRELAAVFAGGAIGTVARAVLASVFPTPGGHWPWPTFAVNLLGAALLGYFSTRLLERLPMSTYRRPLLGTGVCGGLTTFSTMQVETVRMLTNGYVGLAAGYTAASIAGGLAAVYLASAAVRRTRLAPTR